MGTIEPKGKSKRTAPGLQRALDGILERMREELEKLFPQPSPVPIPIPIPGRRIRR